MQLKIDLGMEIPRPQPVEDGDVSEALGEDLARIRDLRARLLVGAPNLPGERTKEQHGHWLLAQMLEWHRREEKSVWWEYFRLRDLTDEEMLDEKHAISGLRFDQTVRSSRSSLSSCRLWRISISFRLT